MAIVSLGPFSTNHNQNQSDYRFMNYIFRIQSGITFTDAARYTE